MHRPRYTFILLLVLQVCLLLSSALDQPFRVAACSLCGQAGFQETPLDPRFGVVEAFWDTDAAVEAGVAWERILFQWSQLQPNGPDDWNTLHVPDEWLAWAQAQGREVVGLLKNTPHWATDVDPPTEASPPRGLELPVDDPSNTWAAFVRRTVAFYSTRGVHRWIIWNEPDIPSGVYGQEWTGGVEGYYRLLKVAYRVIKEVDPEAHVHLSGLTFWHDRDWLRDFLAIAVADPEGPAHNYFFDVVSLHIYFQTDTVDYIVNEARAALTAYGLDKPIWINETNAPPDTDPLWPLERPRWRVDLTEQASFILQSHALALVAGVERIAVYKMIDVGLPPGGEPFGLLRPDHSRRPAYTAYRLVTQHYAGCRAAYLSREPLLTQVTLDRGEWTTRVFWARTGAEVSVTVPALATHATLVDQEGNVQTLDGSSGSYSLTLPGARCADEISGCIIGGPSLLLVEASPAGGASAPIVDAVTPTTEASQNNETPTSVVNDILTVTATVRPTSPALTVPPTATATTTPPATASATPTFTPVPTTPASPTASPSRKPTETASPKPTATAFPSATPTLLSWPSPTVVPSPIPPERSVTGFQLLALAGLVLLSGLASLALWRAKRL